MKEKFYLYVSMSKGQPKVLTAIFNSRDSLNKYIKKLEKEWEELKEMTAGINPDYSWHGVLVED